MPINIVVGSHFGDEGKGLMTDYFSSKTSSGIVIRFNGGAQAGHTVVTSTGKRHVFSHFGSGTFMGHSTYLSSYFVVNPLIFDMESHQIENDYKIDPVVYVNRSCLLTTPYDMLINQIVETYRGTNRHGSCGTGFDETIQRSKDIRFHMIFSYLYYDEEGIRNRLSDIRKYYVPSRLKELGVETIPSNFARYLDSEGIIDAYIDSCDYMTSKVHTTRFLSLRRYKNIVFEGAQGLLLDQDHEFFPYVTHSKTGVANAVEIIQQAGLDLKDVSVTYITRAYMTRHGAGPFPTELQQKPYESIVDSTNIPNEFQGSLRFGYLDLDLLKKSIEADNKFGLKQNVAVTCLDQIDGDLQYKINGIIKVAPKEQMLKELRDLIPMEKLYTSYGPCRSMVRCE